MARFNGRHDTRLAALCTISIASVHNAGDEKEIREARRRQGNQAVANSLEAATNTSDVGTVEFVNHQGQHGGLGVRQARHGTTHVTADEEQKHQESIRYTALKDRLQKSA